MSVHRYCLNSLKVSILGHWTEAGSICALCKTYLEIIHNKWRAKISLCSHFEDGRCSLQNHDSVSSSIVNKRVSPQRCYSFQMIPERKRVLNLNSEKTNITKQTSRKNFCSLNPAKYTYTMKLDTRPQCIFWANEFIFLLTRINDNNEGAC